MTQIIRCTTCNAELGLIQKGGKVKLRSGDKHELPKRWNSMKTSEKIETGCPNCNQTNSVF